MEIKIGVVYSPRELTLEVEGMADEVVANIEEALQKGAAVLWLADKKGRRVGIPADKVAYVEIAEDEAVKRVGFGPE